MIGIKGWNELPIDCEYCPLWDIEQQMCNIIDIQIIENNLESIPDCPLIQIKEENEDEI